MSRHRWSPAQLAWFLAVTRGSRLEGAWQLSALGGLRTCELLALCWGDVDLDAQCITVHHACLGVPYSAIVAPPQYDRERVIPLDPELGAVLRAHWERQQADRSEWSAHCGVHDLVVCQKNGRPLHPRALSRAFAWAVDEAGLPHVGLSALRLAGRALSTAGGPVA